MVDRYKYGPKKINWIDKKMTDQYKCDFEKLKPIGRWPIDLGEVLKT